MKYFLVGYMASGKTYEGKRMAGRLGVRFIDLDAYIVEREKRSIPDIFSQSGEDAFRKLETLYLREVCELFDSFVLSTGGGTPCMNGNMEYMNGQGHTVFLDTDVEVITRRLIRGKHRRPMVSHLSDTEIYDFVCSHLQERLPFYTTAKETMKGGWSDNKEGK